MHKSTINMPMRITLISMFSSMPRNHGKVFSTSTIRRLPINRQPPGSRTRMVLFSPLTTPRSDWAQGSVRFISLTLMGTFGSYKKALSAAPLSLRTLLTSCFRGRQAQALPTNPTRGTSRVFLLNCRERLLCPRIVLLLPWNNW